jgi:HEAT repeat protein
VTTHSLLVAAPVVVLLACLGLVLLIVLTKVVRTRHDRQRAALVAPYRANMLAVGAGEDDEGTHLAALMGADGVSRVALDVALTQLLSKVRGAPAERLADVLHAHGATDRALVELHDRSSVRRARAAQLLGLCHVHRALPDLADALVDAAPEVRASAAHALGTIGNPAVAPRLLAAIGADRAIPAGPAANALEGMGVGISDALSAALEDPSPTTRTVAAYVSGHGSFTRTIPGLRRLVAEDTDLTVRETAAAALGRLGRTEDVEVLSRHTRTDQATALRRACATALGDLGEPAAVPHLRGLLTDPDPRLAELAAMALLRLGAEGVAVLDGADASPAVDTARTIARLQGARA